MFAAVPSSRVCGDSEVCTEEVAGFTCSDACATGYSELHGNGYECEGESR
jgi:hypothetical protein